jgi:hypothetical protein
VQEDDALACGGERRDELLARRAGADVVAEQEHVAPVCLHLAKHGFLPAGYGPRVYCRRCTLPPNMQT